MPLPPVAILIPTMRAHLIPTLIDNIADATPSAHEVYWACTEDSECAAVLQKCGQKVLIDKGGFWPARINALFKWTSEPFVFIAADDVKFHPGWLEAAFIAMERVQGCGIVSVNDLNNPYGTLSLISREYIDTFGGTMDRTGPVIHPGYHHNWSETEMRQTAERRGRWTYCAESVVEHMHHDCKKAPYDEVYAIGDRFLQEDVTLFFSRHPLWA